MVDTTYILHDLSCYILHDCYPTALGPVAKPLLVTHLVMPSFMPGRVSSSTVLWRMTVASIEVSDLMVRPTFISCSSNRPNDCSSFRGLKPAF